MHLSVGEARQRTRRVLRIGAAPASGLLSSSDTRPQGRTWGRDGAGSRPGLRSASKRDRVATATADGVF